MSEARPNICILDYGMGNLRSVEKALEHVGVKALRSSNFEIACEADGLILPGVGAFPRAMERIRELELDRLIHDRSEDGIPILGVCLGLHLLFGSSVELGGDEGLGLLEGDVDELQADGLKVPHIGWAEVCWERESELTAGIPPETPFYFVHSFVPRPTEDETLGTAVYGERFACAAERDNVFGVQFHPEKSSAAGLQLLQNFAQICARAAASPAAA